MKTKPVAFLLILLSAVPGMAQICTRDSTTLCLDGNRFEVDVAWEDASAVSGAGYAMDVADDWGYFWYTDPRYIDAAVKVLDGCGINGRYWVFATLLSDFEQTLTITDTSHGALTSYFNPLGVASPAITDTTALDTCGAGVKVVVREPASASLAPLELAGHFQITVDWRDFMGSTGAGTGVPLTSHSGYFWFFSPDNPELFIKLVDDWANSGYYWVVFGAITTVEFTVTVTNTEDGQTQSYFNPLGNAPTTVIHRQAFVSSTVFADSFESGDANAWSSVVPAP
jgi:hypothetical protein